jgi:hypothetical protein
MPIEYSGVTDELNLILHFNGNKKEVLAFVSKVDTAFRCTSINPNNEDRLYQFVLTRISREPRTTVSVRAGLHPGSHTHGGAATTSVASDSAVGRPYTP